MKQLFEESIELLQEMIATPSFSQEESETAHLIREYLEEKEVSTKRYRNNIWATNKYFDEQKPTILLNSHHDTVKPAEGYSRDPFSPGIEEGKLYGLGSNDAGGALVSLIATFVHFYKRQNLGYNLVLAATAEEEISGDGGIASILDKLPNIDCAIVGEPTQMRMAVAEKGLIVLDCTAGGTSGHAARDVGENAIYNALQDIEWFRSYEFPEQSETLGPVKMTVTTVKAGSQHNVVPDRCDFTVDVRSTDAYSHEQILQVIDDHVEATVEPRSTRLTPSSIPTDHLIVQSGITLGLETFGSATLSDQSRLSVPSLKIGPGKSARSHTADEFIYLAEIQNGIEIYVQLLEPVIS